MRKEWAEGYEVGIKRHDDKGEQKGKGKSRGNKGGCSDEEEEQQREKEQEVIGCRVRGQDEGG